MTNNLLAEIEELSPYCKAALALTRTQLADAGPPPMPIGSNGWFAWNKRQARIWRAFVMAMEGKTPAHLARHAHQRLNTYRELFTELGAYNTSARFNEAEREQLPTQQELAL